MESDQKKNKIGIIVPLFNKVNQINRALDSIFNQVIPFNEIIVVDDCSTDGSLNNVLIFKENYPSILFKVIKHKKNMGPGAARNSGISSLECDIFCFLDADDYLEKDFVLNIQKYLDFEQKNVLMIFKIKESSSNSVRPSLFYLKKFSIQQSSKIWEIRNWESAMIKEPLFCSGGNVILSKNVLNNIKFDESSKNFEDWDFYFKICVNAVLNNIPIKFIDIIGSVYSNDDIFSLSRSRVVSLSMLNPPKLIFDSDIPIIVRKFTYGTWLLHISQRINFFNCLKLIFNILKKNEVFKPNFSFILFSIISSFLGVKFWGVLSKVRKMLIYA